MTKDDPMVFRLLAAVSMSLLLSAAEAAVEPVSPVAGETVETLPDEQIEVMSISTLTGRIARLSSEGKVPKGKPKPWRRARRLTLKWKVTEGEKGPWEILIGKSPDFSDARAIVLDPRDVKPDADGVFAYDVPRPNLEIGTAYHWKVTSDVRCSDYGHVRGCGCKHSRPEHSAAACFRTADRAPRWIALEGRVGNIRDLGGRKTASGRRVRQGMVYRGQGLNDNSMDGVRAGRNRLTVEDVAYLTGELGIRTDLDLRNARETAGMSVSPLGSGVAFVHHPSSAYREIFTENGRRTMASNFRVFCNPTNYPVYFHCISGADRTGALAYVLNGVLGVDRQELETDWESTFYPEIPDAVHGADFWCRESHFNEGFSRYGADGDTWNRRIELYLLDCGVTADEIARFRAIMLEEPK